MKENSISILNFNSQPHEEADAGNFNNICNAVLDFNSQPHEEADWFPAYPFTEIIHFNSQPHEEADGKCPNLTELTFHISTHSLTKRLTFVEQKVLAQDGISTHSLTKRLTSEYLTVIL